MPISALDREIPGGNLAMRHAFLITAYKNPHHLIRFMDLFDERFDFFIHLDARSVISPEDSRKLVQHPRCRLVSRRYVNRWSGVNHLLAMLLLAREALGQADYDYLHVRSGQDYPIRTADAIDEFFTANSGTEFVKNFPLPNLELWGEDGGFDRFRTFQLYTYWDMKNPDLYRLAEFLQKVQRRLGVRRRLPKSFPAPYGGSQWVSFTGGLWRYIIEQWDAHNEWYRLFRFCFGPEEIVLPSLARAYQGGANVSNRKMNRVVWSFRNGNNPANLDESDFDQLKDSDYFFIRKVEYPLSQVLLDRIDRELLGRPIQRKISIPST
jgi:hypothetical protein